MELMNINRNNILQEELTNFAIEQKQTPEDIICSIVYEFAIKLPYSMDCLDEQYVAGDFLNIGIPNSKNSIFKYYDNIYKKMIEWGDSLKSGVLLEACLIFQKMLMNQFPHNYVLNEEDYYNLSINNMTSNEKYNHDLFEILKSLPEYYKKVNLSKNQDERRKMLEEVYKDMQNRIGQKVGGYRKTEINGNVEMRKHTPATINWSPYHDLKMVYYFEHVENYGLDCTLLNESIRKSKTKEINNNYIKKLH
jgi:hypothetical protein